MDEIVWKRERSDHSWLLYMITEWVILFGIAMIFYYIHAILMVILLIIGIPATCYLNYITIKHREKLELRRNLADLRISEKGIIVFYENMTEKYGLPYSVTLKENQIVLFYGTKDKTPTGITYKPSEGRIITFPGDENIRKILNEMVSKYDFFIDNDNQININIENIQYFMDYEKEKRGFDPEEAGIKWRKTRIVLWIVSYIMITCVILTFIFLGIIYFIIGNIEKDPITGLLLLLLAIITAPIVWLPVDKYLLNFKHHHPDMYCISDDGLHYKYKHTDCNETIKWDHIISVRTFTLPFLLLVETTKKHPTSPALRFSKLTDPDANFIFYMTPFDIEEVKKRFQTKSQESIKVQETIQNKGE